MFLTNRFIFYLVAATGVLALTHFWSWFLIIGIICLCITTLLFLYDLTSLYKRDAEIKCWRSCDERFSNGDENTICINLLSEYSKPVKVKIIDEIPVEFQERNFLLQTELLPNTPKQIQYTLTPKRRGEYVFNDLHVYVTSKLHLLERRFSFKESSKVKVFPSFSIIHNMELLSISNKMRECGIKSVRRIGHGKEFEQIKEYVRGDDYRTINWKATARKHGLMCNLYCDEQSQQIYNIIDKGRGMQHAFHNMTLLDYSINAALALSYVTLEHNDNAGLITFEKSIDSHVPASKAPKQMAKIMEVLYREDTSFIQSDYSTLYEYCNRKINKRSLMVIYTTFDSMISMERQLPYLRKLSVKHVVLVVFFKDKELDELIAKTPATKLEYFEHVTAEKFDFEKKLIVNSLQRHGIYSILTEPERLTINVINKYLEMKARQMI